MSNSRRLLDILHYTQFHILRNEKDEQIIKQFHIFKTRQLLSFIHYVFHRHLLSKFIKLYFFVCVKKELKNTKKTAIKQLNPDERLQIWCITHDKVKLFRIRTLYNAARDMSNNFKYFWKISPLIWDIIKIIYFKIIYRFKPTKNRHEHA